MARTRDDLMRSGVFEPRTSFGASLGDASRSEQVVMSSHSTTPIKVRIKGQTKRYGSVLAVDNISLDIHEGEFVTLLGPSGSGKTTVLMMLAGLIEPTSGQIFVDGEDATPKPPYERDMGVVFQSYALFPHMTVFQNIAFPLEMRRCPQAEIQTRVTEALDLVRLPEVVARKPRQLSGGQQQRIALARALVFRPSVLLMDEPLGALDKKLREHMQIEIKRIQSSLGLTAIYVTHDQEEALTMSDRIAVMRDGHIIQIGTPSEMYERPRTTFVADFFGESNILRGSVTKAVEGGYRVTIDGRGAGSESENGISMQQGLEVVVSGAAGLRPAERVVMMVRPENISVGPLAGTANGENVATGTVNDVIYAGEVTRYRIQLNAGPLFTVKQPNSYGITRNAPGDAVTLAWHLADTVLLQEDKDAGDFGEHQRWEDEASDSVPKGTGHLAE